MSPGGSPSRSRSLAARGAERWLGGALVTLVALTPIVVFVVGGLGTGRGRIEPEALLSIGRTLRFSLIQATLSAVAALLLALPGSYAIGRLDFFGKRFFLSLTFAPFVLPGVVVVLALISLFGREGVLADLIGIRVINLYGIGGILIGHLFYNVSIPMRLVGESIGRVPREVVDAARLDGVSGLQLAVRIFAPAIATSALSSLLLVFLLSLSSFAIVLVFGGLRFTTLEVRIYQELATFGDPSEAALIAIVQVLFALTVLGLFLRIHGVRSFVTTSGAQTNASLADRAPLARLALVAYLVVIALFVAVPLVSLVVRAADGFSTITGLVTSFRTVVGEGIGRVLVTSLALSIAAGFICFLAAVAYAYRRRGPMAAAFAQLPLGVSYVAYAMGIRAILPDGLPPFLLVALAQAFIAFPFVYQVLDTTLRSLDPSYQESARTLGAHPFQMVRLVVAPLVRPGVANALVFAFAIPFADFTGVFVVGQGRVVSLPVAIYRLLGFRHFDQAVAIGAFYFAIALLCVYLIQRLDEV